jgi:hypothetical protein
MRFFGFQQILTVEIPVVTIAGGAMAAFYLTACDGGPSGDSRITNAIAAANPDLAGNTPPAGNSTPSGQMSVQGNTRLLMNMGRTATTEVSFSNIVIEEPYRVFCRT